MKGKKTITVALILLMAICLITTGISAANLIGADSVQYKDTTVKAALDDLMDKVNKYKDLELISKVNIGDYVNMTPTSTTYTIPSSLTGYHSSQTIKPSELNLWRVIDIHEDGSIDMVSEYVSNTTVYFYGKTGYLNFVGALNTIAKQYENSNYTIGSRYIGYNGQTEYITDTSKFTYPAPWAATTIDNNNETVGGGDILYEKDYDLVKNALGTVTANNVGTTTATEYWLASRRYEYSRSTYYNFVGRKLDNNGRINSYGFYEYFNGWDGKNSSCHLRPIVTLKPDVLAKGAGTSDDPWVLF